MAKFVTTKFGTKINVEGLNENQVKKVLATAQDKGAYGVKGANLAKTLQKKMGTGGNAGGNKPGTGGGYNLGVGQQGGIDQTQAVDTVTGAVENDFQRNFNANNPGQQTDALGNRQNIQIDPTTGQTSISQEAGAGLTAANNAFTNAATDFANAGSAAEAAAEADYSFLTKDFESRKAREMEQTKTELANRGIPMDLSRDTSLYSQNIGDINNRYEDAYNQARNQSLVTGNQTLATRANVLGTLGATVAGQNPTFTAFQGGQSQTGDALQNLLNIISNANLNKYGLKQKNKGGGGAAADNSPVIGGVAPGFNV